MVLKFDIWFSPAEENRKIHLYLPEDYYESQERYPVVYMFDGHNLFFDGDATYGKSLGLKEFLDQWWKKLIVVGIACSADDWTRVHEYCPYHIQSGIYGDLDGTGVETFDWVTHDLKEYIDQNYRTYPFREATAIAGYSMGGMMALFGGLRHNAYFSKAAVISPSLLPAMEHFKREIAYSSIDPDTRIFFSWGAEEDSPQAVWDLSQSIRYLEKLVQEKGARTYLLCQPGGRHNEGSWEQQVPTWMQFLWT